MNIWVVIGYIGTVIAFGSYVASTKYKQLLIFHIGNLVGSVMLGGYEYTVRTWPPLVLSVLFGTVGLMGIISSSTEERALAVEWIVDHAVSILFLLVAITVGLVVFGSLSDKG